MRSPAYSVDGNPILLGSTENLHSFYPIPPVNVYGDVHMRVDVAGHHPVAGYIENVRTVCGIKLRFNGFDTTMDNTNVVMAIAGVGGIACPLVSL